MIRCDNGPEHISATLQHWAESRCLYLKYIQPGQPQQNAYIERFNRTVRYELLAPHLFESIAEVRDTATHWLWMYNHERPHMALGGITPAQRLAETRSLHA
jgi:putative transposase